MLLWNEQGFIPPISSPTGNDRSPYKISLLDFYKRFAKISPRREELVNGLIAFRSELHSLGVSQGFMWIDGSFLEDIEKIENRPPNDIDAVIFVEQYNIDNIETIYSFFEARKNIREKFHIDSYHVWMDELSPRQLIDISIYWYSMWSHTRNQQWKGFIQIDLNETEDQELSIYLKGGRNEL